MSEQIGIALLAVVLGLVVGSLVASARRVADRRSADATGELAPGGAASRVEARLEVQAAELRRLADAASVRDLAGEQLREGVEGARRALQELTVRAQERRTAEGEQREVIRRLSTVLAGGASKGRAGEHVLRDHLAALPPSMLVTDFRVGGKVVEFGLLLSDGRRLPIDSKWTALAELEALEAAAEGVGRDACARAVEKAVALRAKEVAQYLDPAVTAPVAVAAVPDAAYEILRRAHADAYAYGVVIVPYSAALPIVLFLYSLVQRLGGAADVQATLAEIGGVLDSLESVVENRFARAGTMITNGADEFRSQLGKARGSIARARAASADPLEPGDERAISDHDAGPLSVVL
ncbi:MAG: DNA recombination protein RmuC [Actinomycetota bacterium]|nr:DNA recombination protein RmuC [Actinomycetota bacterium]